MGDKRVIELVKIRIFELRQKFVRVQFGQPILIPARLGPHAKSVTYLALTFMLLALVIWGGLGIYHLVTSPTDPSTWVLIATASIIAVIVAVGAAVWLRLQEIEKTLIAIAGISVIGFVAAAGAAILSISNSAHVRNHVNVRGTVSVVQEAWTADTLSSIPFEVRRECDSSNRDSLGRDLVLRVTRIKAPSLIFIVGQVDRRRLSRPDAEWVRTDLELAQARADCARKILQGSVRVPIYTFVGGPSYMNGDDDFRFADDRRLFVVVFSHPTTPSTIKIDSSDVTVEY